jgi:hypothetical protein
VDETLSMPEALVVKVISRKRAKGRQHKPPVPGKVIFS